MKLLQIRIEDELVQELDQKRAQYGLSRAGMIELLLGAQISVTIPEHPMMVVGSGGTTYQGDPKTIVNTVNPKVEKLKKDLKMKTGDEISINPKAIATGDDLDPEEYNSNF